MLERDTLRIAFAVVGLSPSPRAPHLPPADYDAALTADFGELSEYFDKVVESRTKEGLAATRLRLGKTIERYRAHRYVNIKRWTPQSRDSQQWGRIGKDTSTGRYFVSFGRLDNGLPDERKRWFASKADLYIALTALLANNESLGFHQIGASEPKTVRRQVRPKVEGKPPSPSGRPPHTPVKHKNSAMLEPSEIGRSVLAPTSNSLRY